MTNEKKIKRMWREWSRTGCRLPADQDNWTGAHAEKLVKRAWRLFEMYEDLVDFEEMTNEEVNELYRPYMDAADLARDVARVTVWMTQEAARLP